MKRKFQLIQANILSEIPRQRPCFFYWSPYFRTASTTGLQRIGTAGLCTS